MASIHERMNNLSNSEWQQKEADRRREQIKESARIEKYNNNVEEVMLAQRALFGDLVNIGFISMLEEMTTPQIIEPPKIEQEIKDEKAVFEERTRQAFEKTGKKELVLSEIIPKEEFDERMEQLHAMDSREWGGQVEKPEKLEDGTPDSTLRITLTKNNRWNTPHGHTSESISIAYSESRILVITGESETFNAYVAPDDYDSDGIADGFAAALLHPKKVNKRSMFGGVVVNDNNIVIGSRAS